MHCYDLLLHFLRGTGSTGPHQGQVWPPPWLRRHQHLYPLPISPFRVATVWFFTRVNSYGFMPGGEPPFLFLWDSSWTHYYSRDMFGSRGKETSPHRRQHVWAHSCSVLEWDLLENLAERRHRWSEVCGAQPVKGKNLGARASHTLIEMELFSLRTSERLCQASVWFCLRLLREMTAEHKSLPWGCENFSIWSVPGVKKCH